MNEVESGFEIDTDHGVPLLLGHPEHETILGNASVVDEDVNPSEICDDLLDDSVGLLEVCRVGSITLHLVAECLKFLYRFFSCFIDHEVGECYICAF